MKRLILCLAVLGLPFLSAQASPELAARWGEDASALQTTVKSHIRSVEAGIGGRGEVDQRFSNQVIRFALDAEKLSRWIDQTPETADLGCIFRGMSEEADLQLEKLETASTLGETANALERLEKLFDDAKAISAAASTAPHGKHSAAECRAAGHQIH